MTKSSQKSFFAKEDAQRSETYYVKTIFDLFGDFFIELEQNLKFVVFIFANLVQKR